MYRRRSCACHSRITHNASQQKQSALSFFALLLLHFLRSECLCVCAVIFRQCRREGQIRIRRTADGWISKASCLLVGWNQRLERLANGRGWTCHGDVDVHELFLLLLGRNYYQLLLARQVHASSSCHVMACINKHKLTLYPQTHTKVLLTHH